MIDTSRKRGRHKLAQEEAVKRYNLALPRKLFDEIEKIAVERQSTIVDVLKMFIRLGLYAVEIDRDKDAMLIVREGDREREIVLI
jgi:hypothetical protein